MDKTVIRILVMVGSLILFYLCVLLVASITQLAAAADRIYLGLGQPVFWILISIFLFFVVSPLFLYFKLPKALIPPTETSGQKHEEYLIKLRQRLATNSRLIGVPLKSQNDLQSALAILSQDAEKTIRETASAVFINTAIMQNGRLDGLVTLFTQARMVWKIACAYQQRPSPRQMLYLYWNVGINALIAESIEDGELSEIIAPILASATTAVASSSLVSTVASHLPSAIALAANAAGFQVPVPAKSSNNSPTPPHTSILVKSVTNGAANAFLTLRVGSIARQYCEALSSPSKGLVRRNATLSAIAIIGDIVKDGATVILSGSWGVAKGLAGSSVQAVKYAANVVADSSVSSVKAVGGLFDSTVKGVKGVACKITSKKNNEN